MFEFIRHAFGLCGEGHVSLITVLFGGGLACIGGMFPFLRTRISHWKSCRHHDDVN